MRTCLLAYMTILALVTTTIASWQRDVEFQTSTEFDVIPGFCGIYDGVVVADVIPTWPGREIIQATRDSLIVIRADNSDMRSYAIPQIEPDPIEHPDRYEVIAAQPAVADVDGDSYNEIIAGIMNEYTYEPWCYFDRRYYASLVWWKWDEEANDLALYWYEIPSSTWTYLGTPVIAKTAMCGKSPTVAFWGPIRDILGAGTENCPPAQDVLANFMLTTFDLRDSQNPQMQRLASSFNVNDDNLIFQFSGWIDQGGLYSQAADVDHDGHDEIIVHTRQYILIYDYVDGQWVQSATFPPFDVYAYREGYEFASGFATVADINPNMGDDLEILVPIRRSGFPASGRLLQLTSTGSVDYVYLDVEQNPNTIRYTAPAIGDLSTELSDQFSGRLYPVIETVGNLHLLRPLDLEVAGWPVNRLDDSNNRNVGSPAYADVLGVGRTQIIDATIGWQTVGDDELVIYDPLYPQAPVRRDLDLPSITTGGRVCAAPAVVDADNDGQIEIISCYRISDTSLRIICRDENVPLNPELTEWQQVQNGPAHTGLYAQPVSGTQPLGEMEWSGRVIVHGWYMVDTEDTLTIKPGTVVEFRPGAELYVCGKLNAVGQPHDSIYFKPDGTGDWGGILIFDGAQVEMSHCVIHGGTSVYYQGQDPASATISDSRIYDMEIGVDVTLSPSASLTVERTVISGCDLYGIRGTTSSGTFEDNAIYGCGRAGIYWVGNQSGTQEPPYFTNNEITGNGVGASPIAGGYFNNTTAWLECNLFKNNLVNQIYCENSGNITMNADYAYPAINSLEAHHTDLWCSCLSYCNCGTPPAGFAPLMRIKQSIPKMNYGYNNFIFEADGTYLYDACRSAVHVMKYNYFSPNNDPPGAGNNHFCYNLAFSFPSGSALTEPQECESPGNGQFAGAELAYQEAALAEEQGNSQLAEELYQALPENFAESNEALWAMQNYLRCGLANETNATALHDTLTTLADGSDQNGELERAARREAVWALIAGRHYAEARNAVTIIHQADESQALWAETMLAVLDLLETGGRGLDSPGNATPAQRKERITNFHERMQELLGITTDREALAEAAVPKAKDLSHAYPNPFNSTVTIQLDLPEAARVRLEVFNLLGQKVTTLADQPMLSGAASFMWNASASSAGVYFYRLTAGKHVESHKLLLLK